MSRTIRKLSRAAVPSPTEEVIDADLAVADAVIAKISDSEFVDVRIAGKAVKLPSLLVSKYLKSLEDRRPLYVFDEDDEVSTQVAAEMLGVSRPHLVELLELDSIPHRHVGNQRRILVSEVEAFREKREKRRAGMKQIADVVNTADGRA